MNRSLLFFYLKIYSTTSNTFILLSAALPVCFRNKIVYKCFCYCWAPLNYLTERTFFAWRICLKVGKWRESFSVNEMKTKMRPFNSQDGSGLKQSDENSTFVLLRRDFSGKDILRNKSRIKMASDCRLFIQIPTNLCQIARNAFPTSCIFDVRREFEAGLVRGRVKNLYYFLHRFTLFSCQKSGSPETFFCFPY